LRGRASSFSQELRLANGNASGSALRWIVGGNYSRDKTYYLQRLGFLRGSTAIPLNITADENYADQAMRNLAAFGNAEYDVTPELTLKAGARYTEARRPADICNRDPGDGSVAA